MRRGGILVTCNLGHTHTTMPMTGARQLLLASTPEAQMSGDAIRLPAESVVFVSLSNG